MASNFPAYVAQGAEHTIVRDYTPGTAFVPGSFVVYDTSGNNVDVAGTDPALIMGISEVGSVAHALLTPNGKVPVRVIVSDKTVLALSSATTPADTYIGDNVGITINGTNWRADVAKTTTTSRLTVVDVDITNGIFFCTIHANAMQFGQKTVAQA